MKPRPKPSGLVHILAATLIAAFALSACGPVYVQQADDGYYQNPTTVGVQTASQWDYLNAHGAWVTTGRWGRVWVPTANQDANWRPYYYGRWDHTNYGWTWVSDESWGWGPYHYGRWAWHAQYRWVWVPGYTWGPAWVTWRTGGGCVGWAPMGPRGTRYTYRYWTFIPQRHVYRTRVSTVVIRPGRVNTVYNQSVRITNTTRIRNHRGGVSVYNTGPRVTRVNKWTRTTVRTRNVRTIPSAVPRRRRAPAYRPAPSRPSARPAPSRRAPTYRPAPSRRAPTYRPAPTRRPPTYRPAPTRPSPTYRPAPTRRPPTYRPVPTRRPPTYRPVPTRRPPTYRPAPTRPSPTYRPRPAPTRRPPTYRPAPSRSVPGTRTRPAPSTRTRPAPSTRTRPAPNYRRPTRPAPKYRRSAPRRGRAAPRADKRSSPNRVQPRSRPAPRRSR